MRKWDEINRQFDAPRLSMQAGRLGFFNGASNPNDDEMMRVAGTLDEMGIPSADALQHMPNGVTPDELLQYVVALDQSGDLSDFLEMGAADFYGETFAESYDVAVILCGADVDDMSVDDIIALTPNDTAPVDFARACVLLGPTGRALLLGALA